MTVALAALWGVGKMYQFVSKQQYEYCGTAFLFD